MFWRTFSLRRVQGMPNKYYEFNLVIWILKFLLTDVSNEFMIFGKEPDVYIYIKGRLHICTCLPNYTTSGSIRQYSA
jgi:hypothetical protein